MYDSDTLEYNNELPSSSSISQVGNINTSCDFQILQLYRFEPKNNTKLPVCNKITPDEAEEKSSPDTLDNRGRSEG